MCKCMLNQCFDYDDADWEPIVKKWLIFRSRFHQNVYILNLFIVVEGLSGDEKQPVVKFLRCALPSYDRFSKGHSAAEGCNLKNI